MSPGLLFWLWLSPKSNRHLRTARARLDLVSEAMIDKADAERIAQAVHDLRPEWPTQSVLTLIGNSEDLRTRAYRDLAVAFAYVACDPASLTPGRVREQGPWWQHTTAQKATVSAVTTRCPEHPSNAAWNCPECDADATPPPADWRESVEATLTRRARPARRPDPTPDETRRQALRDQLDAEEAQP